MNLHKKQFYVKIYNFIRKTGNGMLNMYIVIETYRIF